MTTEVAPVLSVLGVPYAGTAGKIATQVSGGLTQINTIGHQEDQTRAIVELNARVKNLEDTLNKLIAVINAAQ